jgi:hypothetical protein
MLRNGVEVFDSEITISQAYNVQKQINKVAEIEDDFKTPKNVVVNNGEIDSVSPGLTTWQSFAPGNFESVGSTTRRRTVLSREHLYETYIRMDATEFIHRGLEVISDEASQKDDDEEVIQVYSDNEKIKEDLEELFIDKLGFDTELWSIIYETCKMGDNFYEVVLEIGNGKAYGIRRLKYIDPSKIEIKEKEGKVEYYIYRNRTQGRSVSEQKLFPWQIIHFKIEDKESKPYGRSLLYSGVRTFSRLMNTEDIFLTYVISRTPSRRVFKIDVGNKPYLEAQREIMEIRDRYRSQQVIDEEGNLNRVASMFSITSDIFIPVREGSSGTNVELLGGEGMNMGQNMTFIDYFKHNLLRTMNIPPEYLGENNQADKSTSLAQRDVKFGRFVERVQNHILKGIYKIATLQLFFLGYEKEDLQDFNISLTPPSTIKEISDIDVITQKIQLIQSMQSLNIFPTTWMLKEVLKLSDKEINDIQFLRTIEEKQAQQAQGQAGMAGGAGGMGQIPMTGELPPEGGEMPAGEMPPEGGELPAEAPPAEVSDQDVENALSGGMEPPMGELQADHILAYTKVLGQNYLIENKQSLFALIRYVQEQNKAKKKKQEPSKFLTEVSQFITDAETAESKKKRLVNPFDYLEVHNEFGGINMGSNKDRSKTYKIYEGKIVRKKEIRDTLKG